MKNLMIILTFIAYAQASFAQIEEALLDKAVEKIEEAIEDSPEEEEEEDEYYDQSYRTSDEEGENGTRYDFNHLNNKPSGQRVACVCMDGARQLNAGFGACSGRGGVRFWIYRTESGEEIYEQTRKHALHPDELSAEELANLAAHQPKRTAFGRSSFSSFGFYDFAVVFVVCATIAYLAKLYFDNQKSDEELPY